MKIHLYHICEHVHYNSSTYAYKNIFKNAKHRCVAETRGLVVASSGTTPLKLSPSTSNKYNGVKSNPKTNGARNTATKKRPIGIYVTKKIILKKFDII